MSTVTQNIPHHFVTLPESDDTQGQLVAEVESFLSLKRDEITTEHGIKTEYSLVTFFLTVDWPGNVESLPMRVSGEYERLPWLAESKWGANAPRLIDYGRAVRVVYEVYQGE